MGLWYEALPVVLAAKSTAVLDCIVLVSGYGSCSNE